MTPSARLLIGCALAVVVPAACLHFAASSERLAAGLSASPFGWPRVLVAHLVAAVPLGLAVAVRLRSLEPVNDAVRGLWLVAGAAVAGAGTQLGPALGEAVAGGGFDPGALCVLRAAFALALVLPWCVWATDSQVSGNPKAVAALGVALAVVPCGLYAEAVCAARTEQANDLLGRERVVRADAVVEGLVELGSERPVGGKSPPEMRKALAALLPKLRQAADRPPPPTAPPAARFNHAVLLIRVDRLAEAAEVLRPLADRSDTAALLLATAHRDQERWAESDEWFAGVLDRAMPRAATDPPSRDAALSALNGLAHNARERRRPADAERLLKRGLETFPERAADFHFQLGRHYADGGRHALAVEQFQTAAGLDAAKYGESAGRAIRSIRTATPACLVGRSH